MEYLKDPYHVWKFQHYFGVEKVKVVENVRGAKYQSKHIRYSLKNISIKSNFSYAIFLNVQYQIFLYTYLAIRILVQ